jgi:hypothetical protein
LYLVEAQLLILCCYHAEVKHESTQTICAVKLV